MKEHNKKTDVLTPEQMMEKMKELKGRIIQNKNRFSYLCRVYEKLGDKILTLVEILPRQKSGSFPNPSIEISHSVRGYEVWIGKNNKKLFFQQMFFTKNIFRSDKKSNKHKNKYGLKFPSNEEKKSKPFALLSERFLNRNLFFGRYGWSYEKKENATRKYNELLTSTTA